MGRNIANKNTIIPGNTKLSMTALFPYSFFIKLLLLPVILENCGTATHAAPHLITYYLHASPIPVRKSSTLDEPLDTL